MSRKGMNLGGGFGLGTNRPLILPTTLRYTQKLVS